MNRQSHTLTSLGFLNSKCLLAAVELKIADILSNGPLTLAELAAASNSRPDRLLQVLRVLYNNGIFEYDAASETFSNNHVSVLIRRDHWTGWHNWVDIKGTLGYDIARGITGSMRPDTTRSAAQINYDTDDDIFLYFNAQGWTARLHRQLGSGAMAMAQGLLDDYPWEEVADRTIIDIGGGGGSLVASLLRRFPTMRGGVFDLEPVIANAAKAFSPGGQHEDVASRVQRENLIAGDFMKSVPPAEAYTMKWVLHDWNDEDSITILKNTRKAIVVGDTGVSRLIVLELILKDGRIGRLSRYGDMNVMMMSKGEERTEAKWRKLAEQSGWNVRAIYPIRNAWLHAIELTP